MRHRRFHSFRPAAGTLRAVVVSACLGLTLAACDTWFGSPEDAPLPGERIAILTLERNLNPDPRIADLAVRLPRPDVNMSWPQQDGTASHAMYHLAAGGALAALWRADIGQSASSDAPLLAQPVVADGKIFTMDAGSGIRAFDAETGKRLWTVEVDSEFDDEAMVGGGIAYYQGRVFVTTGFAMVFALDAATGKEAWRKQVNGPVRAGPAIRNGRVFVITAANEFFALDANDGKELWGYSALSESAGLLGGAPAAAEGDVVVAPFSSGELVALRAENGRVVWTESLTALRRTDPVSSLAHIRGAPVIDRGWVLAISHSDRMVAIDLRIGVRLWEQPIGGKNAPWVAGDFIYVLTNENEVVCLSRRDGRIKWVRPMPRFEDEKAKEDPIFYAGPVLAGDRLLLAGSLGEVVSISPYTGEILGRFEVSGAVRVSPIVANQTVYILTDKAELIALR